MHTDSIEKESESVLSTLTLTRDQRIRSRLKVTLDNGIEAGLFLARGSVLQQDSRLQADSGEVIRIVAASESVSTVTVDDALLLARACYHLGNRHVALQISAGFIRYQHDHVLDDMLRGLGLSVSVEMAPFEPESGAYGDHASSHNSSDSSTHSHQHHAH
jgi:urease accessory protein